MAEPKATNSRMTVGRPDSSSALCRACSLLALKSCHTAHSPVVSAWAPAGSCDGRHRRHDLAGATRAARRHAWRRGRPGSSAARPSGLRRPASAGCASGSTTWWFRGSPTALRRAGADRPGLSRSAWPVGRRRPPTRRRAAGSPAGARRGPAGRSSPAPPNRRRTGRRSGSRPAAPAGDHEHGPDDQHPAGSARRGAADAREQTRPLRLGAFPPGRSSGWADPSRVVTGSRFGSGRDGPSGGPAGRRKREADRSGAQRRIEVRRAW